MNKNTQSVVVTLLGALLISITLSGRYTSYVKPGLGPLLIVSGVVLVLVGVTSVALSMSKFVSMRSRTDHIDLAGDGPEAHEAGGHDSGHSHESSRAPWLILAPIVALLVIAPQALGAAAVSRNAGSQALQGLAGVQQAPVPVGAGADDAAGGSVDGYAANDGSGHGEGTKAFAKQRPTMSFAALPAGKDPTIAVKDFVMRALYDGQQSVSGTPVTLTGFIAPAGVGFLGGYNIARLVISCCAADASPMQIHVAGTAKFPVNTWVTVVVTAQSGTADEANGYVPTADVTSITQTTQPADPYEH